MIYFIQAGDNGAVKIGFAKDVKKRFGEYEDKNTKDRVGSKT